MLVFFVIFYLLSELCVLQIVLQSLTQCCHLPISITCGTTGDTCEHKLILSILFACSVVTLSLMHVAGTHGTWLLRYAFLSFHCWLKILMQSSRCVLCVFFLLSLALFFNLYTISSQALYRTSICNLLDSPSHWHRIIIIIFLLFYFIFFCFDSAKSIFYRTIDCF